MAVFRIEKNKNYTVMANYHLRDISLSLKAKGLLSLMLSLPEGWDYTTKGLACICKDGVDSICSTVRELEKAGYVQRRRLRNELGHLTEIEYTILEKPVRTAYFLDGFGRCHPPGEEALRPGKAQRPAAAAPSQIQTPKTKRTGDLNMKENFTFEEQQLMSIYNPGTRLGLIHSLVEMRTYLDKDEKELKDLTDSAISKLNGITDAEFRKLDLIPDFDY